LLIVADSIEEILKTRERVVGFYGAPPRAELVAAAERLGAPLLDLDVYYGAPSSGALPVTYCHIIRNCVDNALALGDRLVGVVAATGKEKCDAGRYAAWLLGERTGAEIVSCTNEGSAGARAPLLSEARGSLKKRVVRIMRGIVEDLTPEEVAEARDDRCAPTHGFWGTPPHPIELLDLFPETTHVFGWTRCVEQGRPADLELETEVPAGLPVVFFSQGFCPKAQLARHLAERHRGMHVDVHEAMNAATRAKIEAFIRLAVPMRGAP
jgi:hypothetical protein